ncbi:MAG: phosphoglucosamine mutase [Ardenticatenia bacterium]|nr:phosphoglucosamine mutase [Ardenticatenia bacterium]
MALKIGISGLRGTVDAPSPALTPDVIVAYTAAFGTWLRRKAPSPLVAVGRDARCSSPMIARLVCGTLQALGLRVADLGQTLTPTVQFFTANAPEVMGGIMVTASHNPLTWNGLKFLDARGRFLSADVWATLRQFVEEAKWPWVSLADVAGVEMQGEAAFISHLEAVLATVLADAIRRARLRVALDACNSSAVRWIELFKALGCDVVACHTEQHGFFARPPEPLPSHLSTLCALVPQAGCHVGFAADPDGDRLVLVDERGTPVSEEHTVVLCAQERLNSRQGPIVVNVVTTHAVEEMFPHVPVHRTPVGEMNVVNGVVQHGAVLGGEGSGGIIVPDIHLARDGMAAAALVLNLLAQEGQPLSALVARIPPWHPVKARLVPEDTSANELRALFTDWQASPPRVAVIPSGVHVEGTHAHLRLAVDDEYVHLEAHLPDGRTTRATAPAGPITPIVAHLATTTPEVNLCDGLKLIGPDAWLSLRPSNTEPIVRLMGEIRGVER